MDPRTSVIAVVITITCCVVVVARAAGAPSPASPRAATEVEKRAAAQDIRANEIGWREEAAGMFPEDAWSQSDDFHGREARQVRALADQMGIRIEDVLHAIDDDLHSRKATGSSPDPRGAHAIPCKPRPFYD